MIKVYRVYGEFVKDYFPFKGYTGFMVRGAFGMALRKVCCTRSLDIECRKCDCYRKCYYARVFEASSLTRPAAKLATKSGREGIPRPYSVTPLYTSGRNVRFELTLVGRDVIEGEHLIVMALLLMADEGLGIDLTRNERRRVRLKKVYATTPPLDIGYTVFDSKRGYISSPTSASSELLEVFAAEAERIAELRPVYLNIQFKTPFKIQISGTPTTRPPLHAIVISLARKYSLLSEYYGVGTPLSVSEARRLKYVLSKSAKLEKGKYKRLRLFKKSLETGGIKTLGVFTIGFYRYRVDPKAWSTDEMILGLKLLLLGRYLGVGRGSSAGCGRYRLEIDLM